MISEILWSPRAEKEFADILKYLNETWNSKVALDFINELDHTIEIISYFPEIFPVASKRKKVRKSVIRKQVCLYYRVRHNKLEIISLFDNRQHPNKLRL